MIKSFLFTVLLTAPAFAVIGGQKALPSQFQASVFIQEAHCSAVAIRQDLLLMAGHCLHLSAEPLLREGFRLQIVISPNEESQKQKVFDTTIATAVAHPSWLKAIIKTGDANIAIVDDAITEDLAVIKLNEKLPVTPAQLPTKSRTFSDFSNTHFLVTGFGCDNDQGLPTETLKYFSAPLMSATEGQWRYRFAYDDPEKTRLCGGDSGSALYDADEPHIILGINSGKTPSLGIAARLDTISVQMWLKPFLKSPVAIIDSAQEVASPVDLFFMKPRADAPY